MGTGAGGQGWGPASDTEGSGVAERTLWRRGHCAPAKGLRGWSLSRVRGRGHGAGPIKVARWRASAYEGRGVWSQGGIYKGCRGEAGSLKDVRSRGGVYKGQGAWSLGGVRGVVMGCRSV